MNISDEEIENLAKKISDKLLSTKKDSTFDKKYLEKLLLLLTGDQLKFYKKLYPSGPENTKIAISQIERTLLYLNNSVEKLKDIQKEFEIYKNEVQKNERSLHKEIENIKSELYDANRTIKNLSIDPEIAKSADIQDRLDWLNCLENAGVDNWGGFDYAQDLYNGKYE